MCYWPIIIVEPVFIDIYADILREKEEVLLILIVLLLTVLHVWREEESGILCYWNYCIVIIV